MAVMKTISMKELSKAMKGQMEENIEKAKKAVVRGCYRTLPDLVEASPVDTGLYAQSWDVVVDDLYVAIGNTAPYAAIIEYGTRPFTPPIGPLLAWAKRVLRDPSQPGDYSNEVWALAKGVQNKISNEGMKPRAVMRQMIPTLLDNIKKEMARV